jgi:hypothetical protein
MPKETTHRDPEKRAARIERRAKKRAETANRKRLFKIMKANRTLIGTGDLSHPVQSAP